MGLMREATSNDKSTNRCCVCAAWPNQNCFFKNSNIFFLTLGGLNEQAIDAGISIPPAGREGGNNEQ